MEELKKSFDGLTTKEKLERIKSVKQDHIHHLRLSEMDHHQYEYEKSFEETGGENGGNGLSKSTVYHNSNLAYPVTGSRGSMVSSSMYMSGEMDRIKERVRNKLKKFEERQKDILDRSPTNRARRIRSGLGPRSSTSTSVSSLLKKKPLGKNGDGDQSSFEKRLHNIIKSNKSDCEMHSDPESETTPLPYDLPKKRKNSRNGNGAKEYVKKKIEKHEKKKKAENGKKPFEIFINKKKSFQIQPANAKEIRLSAMTPPSPKSPSSPYGLKKKSIKQRNLESYLLQKKKKEEGYFMGIKARKVPSYIKKSRMIKSKKNEGNVSKNSSKNEKKKRQKKFTARAAPSSSHQKSWSEIQEEQEKIRRERKMKRIQELRENSKLPPRMQMAEEQSNRMSVEGLKLSKYGNVSVKPLKRRGVNRNVTSAPRSRVSRFQHKPIPKFEALQQNFESKLQDARKSKPTTVSRPFRFFEGGKNVSDAKMTKVLIKTERDKSRRGCTRWPLQPFSRLVEVGKPTKVVSRRRRGVARIVRKVSVRKREKNGDNSNNNNMSTDEVKSETEGEEEEEVKSSEEGETKKQHQEEERSKKDVNDDGDSSKVEEEDVIVERKRSKSSLGRKKKPPFKKSFSDSSVYEKERLTRSIKLQRDAVKKKIMEREKQKKEKKEFYRKLTRKRRMVGKKLDVEKTTSRLYGKEIARIRRRFCGTKKVKKRSRYDRVNFSPSRKNRGFKGSYVLGRTRMRKGKRSGKSSARDRALEEIGVGEKNDFFDFYTGLHGEITQNSSTVVSDFAGKLNLGKVNVEKIFVNGKNGRN